jgi:hypothetical protein
MKRQAYRHPKIKALRRKLNISRPDAIGRLNLLWDFTADFAPAGDVGRFCDEDIAEACDWPEERAGELIEALVDTGLLDRCETHRLVVHDWADHAEDHVHMRLARAREHFADGSRPKLNRLAKAERQAIQVYYDQADPASHAEHTENAQRVHTVGTTEAETEAAPGLSPAEAEAAPEPGPSDATPGREPPPDSVSDSELARWHFSASASGDERELYRQRWLMRLWPLFAPRGSTQHQSDATSADQLFAYHVWPDGLPPPDARQRFDEATKLADQAKRRDRPMAWLTSRIQERWEATSVIESEDSHGQA